MKEPSAGVRSMEIRDTSNIPRSFFHEVARQVIALDELESIGGADTIESRSVLSKITWHWDRLTPEQKQLMEVLRVKLGQLRKPKGD